MRRGAAMCYVCSGDLKLNGGSVLCFELFRVWIVKCSDGCNAFAAVFACGVVAKCSWSLSAQMPTFVRGLGQSGVRRRAHTLRSVRGARCLMKIWTVRYGALSRWKL